MSMNSNMRSQQISSDKGCIESVSLSTACRALRAACSCPGPGAGCGKMASPGSGLFKQQRASSHTSSSSAVRSPSCTTSTSSAFPTQKEEMCQTALSPDTPESLARIHGWMLCPCAAAIGTRDAVQHGQIQPHSGVHLCLLSSCF